MGGGSKQRKKKKRPGTLSPYENPQEVNYDSPRGGVSVITEKGDNTTSYLLIQKAKYSDSGSYKCIPSNADPLSVFVHVMNEKPEAMQRGSQLRVESETWQFYTTTLIIFLLQ
nr:uncharacterized protein LOC106682925 [Halyomorpha halys]